MSATDFCRTTSSRLTMGFARDGGIFFGDYLSHVDPYWHAPVRAIWFQGALVSLVAVLFFFSSATLEAILAVSTIALTISYAIPIAVLLIVGRDKLVPGPYKLGRFGYTANIVSVVYCCITTVFFFFPSSPNPSGSDMNYAIAVFGIIIVIATIFWFLKGRKTYLKTAAAKLEHVKAEREMYLHGLELRKTNSSNAASSSVTHKGKHVETTEQH